MQSPSIKTGSLPLFAQKSHWHFSLVVLFRCLARSPSRSRRRERRASHLLLARRSLSRFSSTTKGILPRPIHRRKCVTLPRVIIRIAWNHDDWKEVQPRSVTEGCSACRRMEESSLAGYIDRSAHIARLSAYKAAHAHLHDVRRTQNTENSTRTND